jgi:diketogulonate reductase-like aldo/keto reductase
MQLIRLLARPLRRHFSALTRRVGQRMYQSAVEAGVFDLASVEASLADSLGRLRTDHLALLLLHDVRLEDITDELLTFLDRQRASGTVRAIGTATSLAEERRILAAYEGVFDVVQHAWSPLDPEGPPPPPPPLTITHRVLLRTLQPLETWLARDVAAKRALAEATGVDLDAPGMLPALLLATAIAANPTGITLAASRRAERIAANVRALHDPDLVVAGQRLLQALATRTDLPPPLPD